MRQYYNDYCNRDMHVHNLKNFYLKRNLLICENIPDVAYAAFHWIKLVRPCVALDSSITGFSLV